ncbi:MAG: hypothetical protein H7296_13200 [Bacteroidia bacterium]|nr:hypothetical protein [Bacteroidia bacterium]
MITIKVSITQAQIFHKRDSIRLTSIFQAEMGAYMGIQAIKPITTNNIYFNSDGYDKGLLVNFITNISKQLSFSIGYRKSEQTCMIGILNDAFYDAFHLTIESKQYALTLNYNVIIKKNNAFTILIGVANRKSNYKTSNGQYSQFIGYRSTAPGDQLIDGKMIEYNNFLFGISKSIRLCEKIQLKPFLEYEIYSQPLVKVNNYTYLNEWKTNYTNYNQTNYRMGLTFIVN